MTADDIASIAQTVLRDLGHHDASTGDAPRMIGELCEKNQREAGEANIAAFRAGWWFKEGADMVCSGVSTDEHINECYQRDLQEWLSAAPSASGQEERPISEAPAKPGAYIDVHFTTTYRWLAYTPEGARQMKKSGRWQRCSEYGWENAKLPEEGTWTPNRGVTE